MFLPKKIFLKTESLTEKETYKLADYHISICTEHMR